MGSTHPPAGSLKDALARGPVVFDGAMGTRIHELGVPYHLCFDDLSRTRPELIKRIHEEYLTAGAQVLESNSFGGNRIRLQRHGLEGKVREINTAAVQLARGVAAGRLYVAASVGPTGLVLKTVSDKQRAELDDVFREQMSAIADAGPDALVMETFRQPEEISIALGAARAVAPSLFRIALVSFDPFGTMADGTGPEEMAKKLVDWGADAIGVNCGDGPAGVYEMAERMVDAGAPVVAMPNAGVPRRIEGRLAYLASPEYFGIYARRLLKRGVRGVGGCCGTTADHVKRIAAAARMFAASDGESVAPSAEPADSSSDPAESMVAAPGVQVAPLGERTSFGRKIAERRKFVVSVEINPPPGLDLKKAIEGAKRLIAAGVDVINSSDGPRASARMGNIALCHRIQQEVGCETLLHVTTRDRNLLGLLAHLLAAHELDVRNLVVITGDPPKMGDFPDATSVYDVDSVGLLRIARGLNHGLDPGGKPMGQPTRFVCATGVEPAATDYAREMRRLRQKRDAGADLVMTQPVYDPEVLERFLRDVEPLGLPVLVGILPLASYRNAEFLHNEVPGMSVPEPIRERMRKAGSGLEARAEGVAIAREMLSAVKDRVQGAYIMPPFGRVDAALEVLDGIVL